MVKHDNQWGTVCDDGQEGDSYKSVRAVRTAQSACYTLGLSGGSIAKYDGYKGSENISIENVNCASSTTDFLQCSHSSWGSHDCSHSEDILLTCT